MSRARTHTGDGWIFRRNADGSVTVLVEDGDGHPCERLLTDRQWAAVVNAVGIGRRRGAKPQDGDR